MSSTTATWRIEGSGGFDDLKFHKDVPVPKISDHEVLVKIQGASLNYRDLIMPKGKYPFPFAKGVVPGSDGAGTIVEVGSKVRKWKTGDKVVTLFNQGHLGGSLDKATFATGLGGALDGTLRQYAAFEENGLARMPANLSFTEASTLTCAGLTAWNALYGLTDHAVKAGDYVVTQGTGGVSIFALQFAKAAGAKVIATTSSDSKVDTLKKLGADHVINYKTNPKWGEEVKKLTGDRGARHVIEVAGPTSMRQSINSVAMDGVISIIGFLGGSKKAEDEPGFVECLTGNCIVRGIFVGSRVQLEDMCQAIEANGEKLKPLVDPKVFTLEQTKEAYEYMWDQKHIGKLTIKID